MANNTELATQGKKEVSKTAETTVPGKRYMPATDIVETDTELTLYMDMPGVTKDKVKIRLEKSVLEIEGAIEAEPYANIKPLYAEYNIGHYKRNFELSNVIDQDHIEAVMADGVLRLKLPKIPESQPRNIQIN